MNQPYGGHVPSNAAPPVCPRHPDRVSYVSCQRCGRPACVECQRPAAVGIQCVDCVAAEQQRRPTVRATNGVTIRQRPLFVTYAIIGTCVVMYGLQLAVPGLTQLLVDYTPFLYLEPWRMVSGGFLHDDTNILSLHLIMNMLSLWFLGRALEPVVGHWRFAAIFLVGVLGGTVGVALLGNPLVPTLGASGGVFAIGGALLVELRKDRQNLIAMAVILAINLVYGFSVGSGVSWEAHVGGLVTGIVLGFIYASGRKLRVREAYHAVLTLVLLALLSGVSLWVSYALLTGARAVG